MGEMDTIKENLKEQVEVNNILKMLQKLKEEGFDHVNLVSISMKVFAWHLSSVHKSHEKEIFDSLRFHIKNFRNFKRTLEKSKSKQRG